jgi:hypothetical protein
MRSFPQLGIAAYNATCDKMALRGRIERSGHGNGVRWRLAGEA